MDQEKLLRMQQRSGDRKYAKEGKRYRGQGMRRFNVYLIRVLKGKIKIGREAIFEVILLQIFTSEDFLQLIKR